MRAASDEAGVPFNTLSRVEKGQLPDLANYHRITVWLGLDPGTFFPAPERRHEPDTTELIRSHLHSDPNLNEQAAEQIAALVENLYRTLATPSTEMELHLRADNTFNPDAANHLGAMLEHMQAKILADPALGAETGWST